MVTFVYDEDERYLIVEHVPADVCTDCGEKTFSPDVTNELLKLAKERSNALKTINVPVFDFAQTG